MRYNVVEPLKRSGIFDQIALVVPDLRSSDAIEDYADYWQVDFFRGDISNVTKRMLDCAIYNGADVIARVLPWWFFLDTDLVLRQVEMLEQEKLEYVMLPRDFDIRFGADVTHIHTFQRILDAFNSNPAIAKRCHFNPWGYVEIYDADFTIGICEDTPIYNMEKFYALRALLNKVWPEQQDFADSPLHVYRLAVDVLKTETCLKSPRGLDLAYGLGAGTHYLAEEGVSILWLVLILISRQSTNVASGIPICQEKGCPLLPVIMWD